MSQHLVRQRVVQRLAAVVERLIHIFLLQLLLLLLLLLRLRLRLRLRLLGRIGAAGGGGGRLFGGIDRALERRPGHGRAGGR